MRKILVLSMLVVVASWAPSAWAADCNDNQTDDGFEAMRLPGSALLLNNLLLGPEIDILDGQYVLIGDDDELDLTSRFTLEAWVYQTAFNNNIRTRVISKGIPGVTGYGFGSGDNIQGDKSNLRFTTFGVLDYDTTGLYLSLREWTHIAVVLDGNRDAHFYVNGTFVETRRGSRPARTNNLDLLIGRNPDIGAEMFTGVIDEVRIWNEARTDQQILDNYDRPVDGEDPELVAYWRLDDGIGDLALDQTRRFDGLLINEPQWIDRSADCNDDDVLDECQCIGDLNQDNVVDRRDKRLFLEAFKLGDLLADVNCDFRVDEVDFEIYLDQKDNLCR